MLTTGETFAQTQPFWQRQTNFACPLRPLMFTFRLRRFFLPPACATFRFPLGFERLLRSHRELEATTLVAMKKNKNFLQLLKPMVLNNQSKAPKSQR